MPGLNHTEEERKGLSTVLTSPNVVMNGGGEREGGRREKGEGKERKEWREREGGERREKGEEI